MGTFLVFIRKYIFRCGAEKTQASVCFSDTEVNELISDDVTSCSECDYTDDSSNESEIFEEISEEVELNPGHLKMILVLSATTLCKLIYRFLFTKEEDESEDLLSSDFHARSQLVPPLSAISSVNPRSSNDCLNNSDWNAEKKKATGKFSDTTTKKLFSADESASREKLIYPKEQASVEFSDKSTKKVLSAESSSSKEKLIFPKKQEASVHLSDTEIKKVLSADSSASKEKRIYPQKQEASVHLSDATIKNDISRDSSASKEKLRYPQKESTKPDSMLMESKKIASESHDALSSSSCNNQNKHLTVEQSTSSHSDSLRCNSIEQLDNNTVSRYLENWEIFLTKETAHLESLVAAHLESLVAAHLESLEEHEPRYAQKSIERHTGPQDKVGTSSTTFKAVERKIQDYCSSQKILLVGEGDFSFSACLAKAFGSATNMVATSLDSKAYLKRHYRNAMNNISQLRMRGCKVFHGVDATNMEKEWRIEGLLFDRIIYNFPHSGDFSNTEDALWGHQLLIKQFMENVVKMIEEDGEIHIRHKSNWNFWRWNLRGLASEAGGLVLIEEAPFDPCEFSGYNTKYGYEGVQFGIDNNFNCHPSRTYKFVLSKRQKKLRRKNNMLNA